MAEQADRSTASDRFRRGAIRVVRPAAILYVAWAATLYFIQPSMLYLPSLAGAGMREEEIGAIAARDGLVRHTIERDDARIEAWLLRSPQAPARGLVAFFHGNAELIDHALADAREWRRLGFDVLLTEYRGYGRSTGRASQEALVGDALAAIAWARGEAAPTSGALILHGRSLGTGVATQVAARLAELPSPPPTLELLVLESPFTSIASFASRYGLPQFLVRDPYRTDDVLPKLECPVLILHARGDDVVPFSHGETLAALAPARIKLILLEGNHNSGISMTAAYWSAIASALPARKAPGPQAP